MSEKKPIPRFPSEEEEQEFWNERDSTDYVNWNDARPMVLATYSHRPKLSRCDCRSTCSRN
jgi:hypothetical protein